MNELRAHMLRIELLYSKPLFLIIEHFSCGTISTKPSVKKFHMKRKNFIRFQIYFIMCFHFNQFLILHPFIILHLFEIEFT